MKKEAVLGFMIILIVVSILTLAFNIQPAKASGTIYIRADGSVEGTTHISSDDNVTYTFNDNIYDEIVIERDNIILDGADYTVQGTGSGTGIYLSYRSNVTIKNTEIIEFWDGVKLRYSSNNSVFGNNITANNEYGIYLDESSNNTVSGNNANNNYHGIFLYSSENNLISNNTCSSNYDRGISLSHSNHNTIYYNICEDNHYHGIHLDYSPSNTISNNTCKHNGNGNGINLGYSSSNTISNNTCKHNAYNGIGIYDSSNNTISGNTVTANNWYGVFLYGSSNNSVFGNNITANNEYGIELYYSSNNTIFHNNFVNNSVQVYTYESVNVWDDGYPSGGNYWSDHVCTGNPSDGSQPYVIGGGGIDHYPFQDPNGWLPQLTVTSSPITGVTFTIDGNPKTTPYTERLPEGVYTLEMPETHNGYVWSHWLEDGDPNRMKTVTMDINITLTAVFTLDTTPPTISIVSPENKTYPVEDVPLTFTVSESTSWIGYRLDGQANVTITGNTTLTGLSDGSHSLIVYAKDIAGNTRASEMVYFNIETQKAEPFPTLIVAAIVVIGVVGVALLVYFTKVKKTT